MTKLKHTKENSDFSRKENIAIPNTKQVMVHMITNKYKDGTYELRARLINANTLRPLQGAVYKETTAKGDYELNLQRNVLYRRVVSSMASKQKSPEREKNRAPEYKENRYRRAFQTFLDEKYKVPGWGAGTQDNAVRWFEKHFLPHLENSFDGDNVQVIGGPGLLQWRQDEHNKSLKHGNSDSKKTVAGTMAAHYQQCDKIYKCLRKIDPSLPAINSSELLSAGIGRVELEQIKSILESIRQRFYRLLEANIESNPRKVFSAAILTSAGTRIGEAAAAIPSDIKYEYDGKLAVLPVLWQERGGKRDSVLKTANSYRLVPLCCWARTVLNQCEERMGDIPADTTDALNDARELSAWILALLKECGCTEEFLEAVARTESIFPDMDADGMIVFDVASYLLRRDFASRMRNIVGMTSKDLDELLGHVINGNDAKWELRDYGLLEELAKLAEEMERYVYSTDPKYTDNPAYKPIQLTADTNVLKSTPFRKTVYANDTDQTLELSLDRLACGPGEPIYLKIPCKPTDLHARSVLQEGMSSRIVAGSNVE